MISALIATAALAVPPSVPTDRLLDAMYTVESCRGKNLIGDGGKAIGPYQIWYSYWQDAVEYDPSIGGSYRDCMDKAYSERIVWAYWCRYAPKGASVEQLARIHNGGCSILKNTGSAAWNRTTSYWTKILKQMSR